MSDDGTEFDRDKGRRGWGEAYSWTAFVTAGILVYELTNQPAFGTATLCLKFAAEDIKTARWLRRADPWPARGRACAWTFVAWGLWKAAAIGLGVNVIVMPVMFEFDKAQGGKVVSERLWQACVGAGLTSVFSFGCSTVATLCAELVAVRNRLRLWLPGSVAGARVNGLWPPYVSPRLGYNRLRALQISGHVWFMFVGCPLLVTNTLGRLGVSEGWSIAVTVCLWVAGWGVFDALNTRVTAAAPDECWLPDEVAAAGDHPVN